MCRSERRLESSLGVVRLYSLSEPYRSSLFPKRQLLKLLLAVYNARVLLLLLLSYHGRLRLEIQTVRLGLEEVTMVLHQRFIR